MLSSIWVTIHTILKIRDTFFEMFRTHFCLVVLVTSITCICSQAAWMTALAITCSAFMVHWECVRPIVRSGQPGCGRMAVRATGAERAEMEVRFPVTGPTLRRKPRELTGCMASLAIHVDVRPGQREAAEIMVKGGTLPALRRVAGGAVHAETGLVRIIGTVAGVAVLRSAYKVHQAARIQMALHTGHFQVFPR